MIGYLGPVQSFTHQALKQLRPGKEAKAYSSIRQLFLALRQHEVSEIIVPMENSTEGSVTSTIDALYEESAFIREELYLPIHLHLYSKASSLRQITHVLSHPQALAQARQSLETLLLDYTEVPTSSTAQAVEELASAPLSYAAVASPVFADQIPVLKEHVEDLTNNHTRFVLVSLDATASPNANKTSVLFIPQEDRAGLLYDLLHEFAIRKLNLTRIESRRDKKNPDIFAFYLDVSTRVDDPAMQEIFDILSVKRFTIKVLGSYPSGQ